MKNKNKIAFQGALGAYSHLACLEIFPNTKGAIRNPTGKKILNDEKGWNQNNMIDKTVRGFNDEGTAARYFYCAKANKKDRDEGNKHPTVKPTELMRYLCRLVTPQGGIVLDPFMGSGSTGKAAVMSGFKFVGIEMDEEYFEIACTRIKKAQEQRKLF